MNHILLLSQNLNFFYIFCTTRERIITDKPNDY